MKSTPHGHIDQSSLSRKDDFLYRISLKALIVNEKNEILVVKESGRTWWDLPGGGMDHDETIKDAIARELAEEVSSSAVFSYKVIAVDEPAFLPNANVWQVRMIFRVTPSDWHFAPGEDADEVMFIDPKKLLYSDNEVENRIARYLGL